uniref:Uncharacterized protein n=1 Tax=Marseillevirus LCMAC103 TaxID=2506604 RepID=A0A481YW58_9VIRU|nr:MAG: hypothetical protein LCMAC103_01260 [Marseillevirus LCMAC103]
MTYTWDLVVDGSILMQPGTNNDISLVTSGTGDVTVNGRNVFGSDVEVIFSVSDFPTAVAGVHTLVAGTTYRIEGSVDIGTNRIVISDNCVVCGFNRETDILTSTTTGALFTATSVSFSIRLLQIVCTAVGSEVFNCTLISGDLYEISDCYFLQCQSLGFIDGGTQGKIFRNYRTDSENGLELRSAVGGTHVYYNLNINHANNAGIDLLVAGGSFTVIEVTNSHFHPGVGITGLDIADTITIGDGVVALNSFRGPGTPLATGAGKITNATPNWVFIGNGSIVADSDHFAEMLAIDNPTTVFTNFVHLSDTSLTDEALNLPLPVVCTAPGAWVAGNNMRFSFSLVTNDEVTTGLAAPNPEEVPVPSGAANDNGRLTYDGEAVRCFDIIWKGSAEVDNGANRRYQFLIGRGNTTDSVISTYADATGGVVTVTTGTHGLSVGDVIFVRRSGSTAAWQFLGPHTITAVPSATTFEYTFRDPAAGGFPGAGLTGGEWVLMVDKSRSLLALDSADTRMFIVAINVVLDPDDFIEPFAQYDGPSTGTDAHLRLTVSHNTMLINT